MTLLVHFPLPLPLFLIPSPTLVSCLQLNRKTLPADDTITPFDDTITPFNSNLIEIRKLGEIQIVFIKSLKAGI